MKLLVIEDELRGMAHVPGAEVFDMVFSRKLRRLAAQLPEPRILVDGRHGEGCRENGNEHSRPNVAHCGRNSRPLVRQVEGAGSRQRQYRGRGASHAAVQMRKKRCKSLFAASGRKAATNAPATTPGNTKCGRGSSKKDGCGGMSSRRALWSGGKTNCWRNRFRPREC